MSSGSNPYIQWSDVTITEELVEIDTFDRSIHAEVSSWTAEFNGHVYHDGLDPEQGLAVVEFSRTGDTADLAAQKLFAVATSQGWEVH